MTLELRFCKRDSVTAAHMPKDLELCLQLKIQNEYKPLLRF